VIGLNRLIQVRTNQDYDKFVTETEVGHVADYSTPLKTIVKSLSEIRGHIVEMPLRYMENAHLIDGGLNLEVNNLTGNTSSVYRLIKIRGNILVSGQL
jgi:hypothetical protein